MFILVKGVAHWSLQRACVQLAARCRAPVEGGALAWAMCGEVAWRALNRCLRKSSSSMSFSATTMRRRCSLCCSVGTSVGPALLSGTAANFLSSASTARGSRSALLSSPASRAASCHSASSPCRRDCSCQPAQALPMLSCLSNRGRMVLPPACQSCVPGLQACLPVHCRASHGCQVAAHSLAPAGHSL